MSKEIVQALVDHSISIDCLNNELQASILAAADLQARAALIVWEHLFAGLRDNLQNGATATEEDLQRWAAKAWRCGEIFVEASPGYIRPPAAGEEDPDDGVDLSIPPKTIRRVED